MSKMERDPRVPMTERMEEIRRRHEAFITQYSPGPDWEPCNQMSLDRGWLLDAFARVREALDQSNTLVEARARVRAALEGRE